MYSQVSISEGDWTTEEGDVTTEARSWDLSSGVSVASRNQERQGNESTPIPSEGTSPAILTNDLTVNPVNPISDVVWPL